jgi:F420H(2)-dependent quinone reductase
MPLSGEYEPSPQAVVRGQVEIYERTSGQEANNVVGHRYPVVLVTTRGAKSVKLRKNPVIRVTDGSAYPLVASKSGSDEQPQWHNLKADPDAVELKDGPEPFDGHARELSGDERQEWWNCALAVYPSYAPDSSAVVQRRSPKSSARWLSPGTRPAAGRGAVMADLEGA